MAHEISIRTDGTAEAFYADRPAWHKLGQVVQGAQTGEEAIRLAQLGWATKVGQLWGGPDAGHLVQSADRFTIYREDTGAILGTASKLWTPFQNVEAVAFLDSLLADGTLTYESAGALKGGRECWALARLAKGFEVGGEAYGCYLLITWGHNAGIGIRILPTWTRVVCFNTLTQAIAIAEKDRKVYTVNHLPGLDDRLDIARKALTITDETTRATQARLESLLSQKATKAQTAAVVEALFGKVEDRKPITVKHAEKFCSIVDEEITRNGRNGYSLLQGITGYADHGLTVLGKTDEQRAERRFSSVFDGAGAAFKREGIAALATILK